MADDAAQDEIPFQSDEIEWLNFNRGITRDDQGRRVFTGLDFAESKEYYFLKDHENVDFRTLEHDEYERRTDRYLELWRKHEQARILMCVVVEERETKNPTIN